MPVTFETDLKDLEHFDYVPQIPLEALFKNMAYKQAKYDQGFQQAQATREALNVKAYGQDAVRRDQLLKQIDEESKKFAGADFSDKKVLAEYTNWLNSIASSPEWAGFKARADARDKAQAQYDKLTADGKTVISPHNNPLLKMDNYFNGGESYSSNKRFKDTNVYIDFNFADLDKDVVNNTKEIEQMKTAPGGQLETYKGLATNALYANLSNAYLNNPGAKREMLAQYQSTHSPQEFAQMSLQDAESKKESALQSAGVFRRLASQEPDGPRKTELLTQANKAEENANFWGNFNASDNPDLAYQYGFEDFVRNKALQRAEANTTYALKDIKTRDNVLVQQRADLDLRNALKQEVTKAMIDRGEVTVDASGNITGYTPGKVSPKSPTGGRTVKVGNINYDYETFFYKADQNEPNFISSLAKEKDFTINKDGYQLFPGLPITAVTPNKDGTYTITGMFSGPEFKDGKQVIDEETKQPVISNQKRSITVTKDDIVNSYLGQNIQLLKKSQIPPTVTEAGTMPKVTAQRDVKDDAGNVVIKVGTKVPSYKDENAAKVDTTLKAGSYFYDESVQKYKQMI